MSCIPTVVSGMKGPRVVHYVRELATEKSCEYGGKYGLFEHFLLVSCVC